MSHFFAYLARMKLIKRWGLMQNISQENIQEHSLQVAVIAHGLAIIKNKFFSGSLNPEYIMALAIYHEVSEVITGDLATPIKYFNPEIKKAYQSIEEVAKNRLLSMLPNELHDEYYSYFSPNTAKGHEWTIVKAADKISAYIKCLEEIKMGNKEFMEAKRSIRKEIDKFNLPEVDYFMETFIPSFNLSLDELN